MGGWPISRDTIELSANEEIEYLMTWVDNYLSSGNLFPTQVGTSNIMPSLFTGISSSSKKSCYPCQS